MTRHCWYRVLVVGMGVAGVAATAGRAETWPLGLKRLESTSRIQTTDEIFVRYTYPQHLFMQIDRNEGSRPVTSESQATFSQVVKKELPRYESDRPFRGVATLGGRQFGFVLDATSGQKPEPKDDAKNKRSAAASRPLRYDRLYFDLNGNGDLTDEKAIDAESQPSAALSAFVSSSYASSAFPRIDITLQVEGTTLPYSFFLSATSYRSAMIDGDEFRYVSVSINAAAYREGEITLKGEKKRVFLIDFNSNGRFDDQPQINDQVQLADGTVYTTLGDMIYLDPGKDEQGVRYGYDVTASDEQHFVSKYLNVAGRYHALGISPAGDKLTLEASPEPMGYVTNANKGYRAVVYGEKGFVKLAGDESGRAPLPAGTWRLAHYTIDRTGFDEAAKPEEEKPSLFKSLSDLFSRSGSVAIPRTTLASARAKRDVAAIAVGAGETVQLPFGPPFKPVVDVSGGQGTGTVSLGLSLIGSAGERCSSLTVDGQRPPKPKFTITGPDGKLVESGTFEYG